MDEKFPGADILKSAALGAAELAERPLARRSFLKCSAWAGAGVVWTVVGGVPTTAGLLGSSEAAAATAHSLTFAQISDTHIGFNKAANMHVEDTAKEAVAKIGQLPKKPAFLIHTGDLTHLGQPAQYDRAEAIVGAAGLDVHYVPGEHDISDAASATYWASRFNPRNGAKGWGWYSFDHGGVHFIALVNVVERKDLGAGSLGADQLAWLKQDLAGRSRSTPIVVFAHIPLFTLYADWGWATANSADLFALLRPFGSVTVLNGHVHQVTQKVEGRMVFHTARSTAYPQPAPGTAPAPGPLVLPPAQLPAALGIRELVFRRGHEVLAVTDETLV